MEPSYHISRVIRKTIPIANNTVSKLMELLNTFSKYIFPKSGTFVHFDNAAMPGIFPYAMNYYVHAFHPDLKYEWYASSLITPNDLDKDPLMDQYGLWKNYPGNWLMDEKHNGDVMDPDEQKYFQDRLAKTVDLYTSDIGFDVSMNYNEQETLQSPANLGQIISGLLTLKEGGCLITKQYTFMTPFTISLMGLLTKRFDRLYITKPMTSKPDNSETYLVGIGYKGDHGFTANYLMELLRSASVIDKKGKIVAMKPVSQKKCINTQFVKAIGAATHHISGNTIAKIRANLKRYAEGRSCKGVDLSDEVDEWFAFNPIKPIPRDKFLKTTIKSRSKKPRQPPRRKNKRSAKK